MAWNRRRNNDNGKTKIDSKRAAVSLSLKDDLARSRHSRVHRLEVMEARSLMAADTIWVGGVYFEEDSGGDYHGDIFQVTFEGGAAGTTLTRLIIDGDQNAKGYGVGDLIFDTLDTGYGSDHSYGFKIIDLKTADPKASVIATVEDGSTRLVLDFQNFRSGDKLIFEIDVDEIQQYDPTEKDLSVINEGIDPITSGVEFQGSMFEAFFSAPHYVSTTAKTTFLNRYDSLLVGTNLNLPEDNFQGKRDRSTGAVATTIQQPLPVTLAGKVFVDNDLNLLQSTTEKGISGVRLDLYKKATDGSFQSTGYWTVTDSLGRYRFGAELKLQPAVYQLRQTQPDGYFSVGAIPGRIAQQPNSVSTGEVVAGNLDWLTEIDIPKGDLNAVDLNFAEAEPAELSGFVYVDTNNDGIKQSTEQGIAGVTIRLEPLGSNSSQVRTMVTDANGRYLFTGLMYGSYRVVESVQPTAYLDGKESVGTVDGKVIGSATVNDAITNIALFGASIGREYNFGEILGAEISGKVFHDKNNDGRFQSATESGIAGAVIKLLDESGNVVGTISSDAQGNYRFTNLQPGTYSITETTPNGYLDGKDEVGTINGSVNGVLEQSDRFGNIVLVAGNKGINYNFGEILPGRIAGKIWVDSNPNGKKDPSERILSGVKVELLDESGKVIATTTTDATGRYVFDSLPPGKYQVREIQPSGYFQGGQLAPPNNGNATKQDLVSDVVVGSGEQIDDIDFYEIPPAKISGYVFQDGEPLVTSDGKLPANLSDYRDGKRTSDDRYLSGVRIELRKADGKKIDSADVLPGFYSSGEFSVLTNVSGFYEFAGLRPGNYTLYEIQPQGYQDGLDTAGSTGGVAVNRDGLLTIQQQQEVALLNASPLTITNYDAIIGVGAIGDVESIENNFSEVVVKGKPIPPVPPIENPRPNPEPPIFSPFKFPAPPPPLIAGPWVLTTLPPDPGPGHDVGYTWHLSVINAGYPRGDRPELEVNRQLAQRFSRRLNLDSWVIQGLNDATMMIVSKDDRPPLRKSGFDVDDAKILAGDFNGDGTDETALFLEGEWLLDTNGNGRWDRGDLWLRLGGKGDYPVVGDWDNDGKDDVGIFGPQWRGDRRALAAEVGLPTRTNPNHDKPQNPPPDENEATDGKRLMQRTANAIPRADNIDHVFRFGYAPDTAVAGDWNGDGISKIGIYRNGLWILDEDGDGQFTRKDKSITFGQAGDQPLVGDFDGDGIDELAIQRGNQVIVDSNHNGVIDATDMVFELQGLESSKAVVAVGDFDGDGKDEPAVHRKEDIKLPLETKRVAG